MRPGCRKWWQDQRGDASLYALAVGCLFVFTVLFLALGDFTAVIAVREQAQLALVTSTRAAARQIDEAAWVQQHQLRVDGARAASVFTGTLDANMPADALIPSTPQRSFQLTADAGGHPVAAGEIWVPVRTPNLHFSLVFHLKYDTHVTSVA